MQCVHIANRKDEEEEEEEEVRVRVRVRVLLFSHNNKPGRSFGFRESD